MSSRPQPSWADVSALKSTCGSVCFPASVLWLSQLPVTPALEDPTLLLDPTGKI